MEIVNLTPHTLNIVREDGVILTVPTSGTIARLAETRVDLEPVDGISVYASRLGKVEGIPDYAEGTIYVVSLLVEQVTRRQDVFSPGDLVRNDNNAVVGCKGLRCTR